MSNVLRQLHSVFVRPFRGNGLSRVDVVTLATVVSMLAIVEWVGRSLNSEVVDLAAVVIVSGIVGICVCWHRMWKLRWTQWIGTIVNRMKRHFQWLSIDVGLDLRRTPPIARKFPPRLVLQNLAVINVIGGFVTWELAFDESFRSFSVQGWYLGYVSVISVLWGALLCGLFVAILAPAAYIFDLLVTKTSLLRRKAWTMTVVVSVVSVVVLLLVSTWIAEWMAIAILVGLIPIGVLVIWAPPRRRLTCLWRDRRGSEIRAIDGSTFYTLEMAFWHLLILLVCLLAIGPPALGLAPHSAAPRLMAVVGTLLAWLCCYCLGVVYFIGGVLLYTARLRDPERPVPTSVYVQGVTGRTVKNRIRRKLRSLGWTVRFAPARMVRTDVRIRVAETGTTSEPTARPSGEREPTFEVTEAELDQESFVERVARRDVIQRRRILVRALQTIFRRAASRPPRTGCGYWVAPHYWFVCGVTRDETDDEHTQLMGVIPPLYHRVMPPAVRHHMFEICSALQIDLIFVEDGVGFRNFRRVLRVLFERFDVHGGQQPAQEVDFAGLPKTRVVIEHYAFEKPLIETKYPEPNYEDVGRARILHIFRDRGEEDPTVTAPTEYDYLLTPV